MSGRDKRPVTVTLDVEMVHALLRAMGQAFRLGETELVDLDDLFLLGEAQTIIGEATSQVQGA